MDIDFKEALNRFGACAFHLVTSYQLMSWLSFEDALELLRCKFGLSRNYLFLSSLFAKDNLDFEIRVRDQDTGKVAVYNIYTIDLVKRFAADHTGLHP